MVYMVVELQAMVVLPMLNPTPKRVSVEATMNAALFGKITMRIETIEFQAQASATPSKSLQKHFYYHKGSFIMRLITFPPANYLRK